MATPPRLSITRDTAGSLKVFGEPAAIARVYD
jgi:hypothetical protein